jgi:hypothetical protein
MNKQSINKWLNFLRCSLQELKEQVDNLTLNGVIDILSIEQDIEGKLIIEFLNSQNITEIVVSTYPVEIMWSSSEW